MLGALGIAYFHTIQWLFHRFIAPDSYYSHGFIVPLISLYFVWKKRTSLDYAEHETGKIGGALVITALLVHLLGTVLYIFSLSGLSLFIVIVGSVWFFFGKEGFKQILFPIGFLLFMFPVPEAVLTGISFPLKMVVANISVFAVRLMGIPVLQEGFQITIPAGKLLVGNPCSGLRSIIAFLAIASIFAYLRPLTLTNKVLFFFSAIPIAMIANVLRVLFLILVSHFWGLEVARPESFWHTASGIGLFVIGLLLLFITGNILDARENKK